MSLAEQTIVVLVGIALLRSVAVLAGGPPHAERVDAQMLLELDMLNDEEFAARSQAARSAQASGREEQPDDLDPLELDDRDVDRDIPRR
jgi:hypothetical protein